MTSAAPRKLLVVDDQPVIHDAFRAVFAKPQSATALDDLESSLFGEPQSAPAPAIAFTLDHAFQGQEGLAKVEAAVAAESPYAVAFVDMRMPPGWDGLETIERLLAADAELQIVMCTAYSDYTWEEVLARLGCTDRLLLLKKPFATEEAFQLAVALSEKYRLLGVAGRQLSELEAAYGRLQHEVAVRRSTQEQLLLAATHDALTELPNRTLFNDALRRACGRWPRPAAGPFDAVFFLDVDNFKMINDVYGHEAGDKILRAIADRLRGCYRRTDSDLAGGDDLPARFGGDEFVLLIRDVASHTEIETIARRIVATLKAPIYVEDNELVVTSSVGIAPIVEGVDSSDEALRRADIAMYQAKLAGKDQFAVFDLQMHQAVVRRLEVEAALAGAIERNELRLVYQPILDSMTGTLEGFEALLRWTSLELGEVSPGEFIAIAEESRLMAPVGEWVLREGCRQLAEWRARGSSAASLRLSVNVSRKQLARPDFLEVVKTILADHPDVGSHLNFEITESTVMSNPVVVAATLVELRKLGICIHMDDFGTGHSSLSCLHQFPIDVLKIDRSFVMSMDSNADYQAVIHSIITLAHHLNVKVVAEGVENQRQATALRDLGCEMVQGYFFSKPVPREQAGRLIDEFARTEANSRTTAETALVPA